MTPEDLAAIRADPMRDWRTDALLAEVDRLTALTRDGLVNYGRADERARIRAAVDGLGQCFHMGEDYDHMAVDRAAVLALLEGEA